MVKLVRLGAAAALACQGKPLLSQQTRTECDVSAVWLQLTSRNDDFEVPEMLTADAHQSAKAIDVQCVMVFLRSFNLT